VSWLLVALGAAVGAPLRYVAAVLLDGRLPRGTILVNWVGSLLLGWFTGLALTSDALALLGTGFCGGLTTFSSFALHTHDRGPRLGAVNVLLTVVPALVLCAVGFRLGVAQA
jgi:CrcB protein